MFAVDPGVKDASCLFLMASEAVPDLVFRLQPGGRKRKREDQQQNDSYH